MRARFAGNAMNITLLRTALIKWMVRLSYVMAAVWLGSLLRHDQPKLSAVQLNAIEDHPVEFLADKQIDIHIPSKCPAGMVKIEDKDHDFCLDVYEAPNLYLHLPYYALTFSDAEQYCASQHKRLATEEEWETACLGPAHHQFFYGNTYHLGWCRDDAINYIKVDWWKLWFPNTWRPYAKSLFKGSPSGSHPLCTNEYGLFDMLGNTTEIVKAPNRQWGYATKGGFWHQRYGGPEYCTFSNFAHPNRFRQYEAGTRCAISAD
jgi:hypothetical protein